MYCSISIYIRAFCHSLTIERRYSIPFSVLSFGIIVEDDDEDAKGSMLNEEEFTELSLLDDTLRWTNCCAWKYRKTYHNDQKSCHAESKRATIEYSSERFFSLWPPPNLEFSSSSKWYLIFYLQLHFLRQRSNMKRKRKMERNKKTRNAWYSRKQKCKNSWHKKSKDILICFAWNN